MSVTINHDIFITAPSFHHPENNNTDGVAEISFNEGLERIGTSLQQLIEEAQKSLLKKPSQNQQTTTDTFVNYSYHYIQTRYTQSQERLVVAMEELEQSLQNLAYTPTIIMNHHHSHTTTTCSSPPTCPKRRRFANQWPRICLITLAVLFYSFYSPQSNLKYDALSLALVIISFYRQRPRMIISTLDKLIMRLRGSSLLQWIHRMNICFYSFKLIIKSHYL